MRIGVIGYGTIGKRIADAVRLQEDMELVGVVKPTPDYQALAAARKGIPVYAYDEKSLRLYEEKGLPVEGTMMDLLEKIDVAIDASPGGKGAENKKLYEEKGLRQIYQGGEKSWVAEASYNSLCNHDAVIGARSLRVVSCNTTGLLRLLCSLDKYFGVEKARVTIIRRAADPRELWRGPVNTVSWKNLGPSHHEEDARTVKPGLDLIVTSIVAPTTLAHIQIHDIKLRETPGRDELIEKLASTPRILLLDTSAYRLNGTGAIIELARDLGRSRNDLPENLVLMDSIRMEHGWLRIIQVVHQESIVIPENIDAVRAMMGKKLEETLPVTDKTLGLLHGVLDAALLAKK